MKGWYYIATYTFVGRFVYMMWGELTVIWGEYYHTWITGLLVMIWMKLFWESRAWLFLVLGIVFAGLLIWELTAISTNDYSQAINNETVGFCFLIVLLCSILIISLLPIAKWRKVKY